MLLSNDPFILNLFQHTVQSIVIIFVSIAPTNSCLGLVRLGSIAWTNDLLY